MTGKIGDVGIIELIDVCVDWRRRCLDAFEVTGQWATTIDAPADQRVFAEATHRHAWHADLWAQRLPVIPHDAADGDVGHHRVGSPPATGGLDPQAPDARSAFHDHVVAMLDDLDHLARRVDPELDPCTVRTISLVRADLVDLRDRSA